MTMAFERWQAWAANASREVQANACAALGVAAASESASRDLLETYRTAIGNRDLSRTVLVNTIRRVMRDGRWAPPSQALLDLPLTPGDWSAAWSGDVATPNASPVLRFTGETDWDDVASWSQLLAGAKPAVGAATLSISAPSPQLVFGWPLRFATMPGNAAAGGVDGAIAVHWAQDISEHQAVQRGQANSDVLVHVGTAADLLDQLRSLRIAVKTNLIVLASVPHVSWDDAQELLSATNASGIATFPAPLGPLPYALATFLRELSHNARFDAALFKDFVREQPMGTTIALTDELARISVKELGRGINELAAARMAPPPMEFGNPNPSTRTRSQPPLDLDALVFDHEYHGARTVAVAAREVNADIDQQTAERTESRFLQAQFFTTGDRDTQVEASTGFLAKRPAEVRVRIAPPDEKWTSLDAPFPTHRLPQNRDEWSLTIWLTEPNHYPKPMPKRLTLRHTGASAEVAFHFTPVHPGPFEGRITVLHRGRVLQTAMLVSEVHNAAEPPADDAKPRLTSLLQVRRNLADLEGRREFDASFVFNKTTSGVPRMAALSKQHAFVTDLDAIKGTVDNIYGALSSVENNVAKYKKGLADENGRAFLVDIAREGAQLYTLLIKRQLQKTAHGWALDDAEYLQVVHTKVSGIVPLEFVYSHVSPERSAKVCPHWQAAITAGKHRCSCDPTDATIVCPLGFWGVSKVIERHLDDPAHPGRGLAHVQNEPTRKVKDLKIGGAPLIAWSENVKKAAVSPLLTAAKKRFLTAPTLAADWKGWLKAVNDGQPRFLLAMPHNTGTGASATLEIGGSQLEAADLKSGHVCCGNKTQPLVALLGCDTASTADNYAPHVIGFQDHGAAVVICTVATVFGDHAPAAATLLIDQLLPDHAAETRLGEVLRSVKQQGLLDHQLIPLCLVAYGDADWRIVN